MSPPPPLVIIIPWFQGQHKWPRAEVSKVRGNSPVNTSSVTQLSESECCARPTGAVQLPAFGGEPTAVKIEIKKVCTAPVSGAHMSPSRCSAELAVMAGARQRARGHESRSFPPCGATKQYDRRQYRQ